MPLKHYFITGYLLLIIVVTLHAVVHIFSEPSFTIDWFGVLVAALASIANIFRLFIRAFIKPTLITALHFLCIVIGCVLSTQYFNNDKLPFIYTLLLVSSFIAYISWYNKFNHKNKLLQFMGEELPMFSIPTIEQGEAFNSQDLIGQPSILIFYRGNWCPICVNQIKELTDNYDKLETYNTKLYFISPQGTQDSKKLRDQINVEAKFAVDKHFSFAKMLGIYHKDAVPSLLMKKQKDSVYPTVIITDKQGKVAWIDLSDDLRIRPEFNVYIKVLKGLENTETKD